MIAENRHPTAAAFQMSFRSNITLSSGTMVLPRPAKSSQSGRQAGRNAVARRGDRTWQSSREGMAYGIMTQITKGTRRRAPCTTNESHGRRCNHTAVSNVRQPQRVMEADVGICVPTIASDLGIRNGIIHPILKTLHFANPSTSGSAFEF